MNVSEKENVGDNFDGKVAVEIADDFKVSGWGRRHQQSLILFFSLAIAYSLRACMGVALVAMTDIEEKRDSQLNLTAHYQNNNKSAANQSQFDGSLGNYSTVVQDEWTPNGILNALMLVPPYPKFNWNKKVQDLILSSFFWGYTVLQIPSGYLAHRFGARYMLTGAMLINCVLSICLPWLAYYGGWVCTVLCRALQGLSQACIMPGIHTFFGKWAPLEERGRLTAITYGGQALGPVIGFPLTGFIAASSLGWPGIFRFYGGLSGLVGVLIWWKAADTPAKHPDISATERRYIEEGLGQKGQGNKHLPVPWSRILRSRGVYAIIIAHIGTTWGQLTIYTEVPAFMNKVMGVNIKANGLLSSLPFLVMFFTNYFFSWLTDMLIVKKVLSVTHTRKLATTIGSVAAAIGLVALAYVPKNIYLVESLLVAICALKVATQLGFQLNHIDMSPNFAGTLMSLSNFSSNFCGSFAPLVAGFILTDPTSEYLWSKVFLLSAGMYTVTNIAYLILGTAEKADWNDPPEENIAENGQDVPMLKKLDRNDERENCISLSTVD